MFKSFKPIIRIINVQTIIISGLSVLSTYLCIHNEWQAEFPFTIIATAVVFPIVFSIGGAYNRREAALKEYAAIKGYLRSIYYVSRDWITPTNSSDKTLLIIDRFFTNFRNLLPQPITELEKNEQAVYKDFSSLSKLINDDFRLKGLPSGECSRTNQYLQKLIVSFETVKHIYQYRTPRTLRAFSTVFIVVLPILYGPFFAFLAESFTYGLEYVIPVLLSMILCSLDNIQEHLENPFDQIGEDDIKFNVEKFVSNLALESES